METLNPEHIQPEDWSFPNRTACSSVTAILIHDGGGTTYPYHCLGSLYRNVYGIRNPYFYSGNIFAEGLPEMGKVYADYIRTAIARKDFRCRRKANGSVDIILGGWSLGGMLALQVARELQADKKINVAGIVMIDSAYAGPEARKLKRKATNIVPLDFAEEGRTRNEVLSLRCMSEATYMLDEWKPPKWKGELAGKRPKTIMIRARENYPVEEGMVSSIDMYRQDPMLGWGEYDPKMFTKILEVPGNHFDLFEEDKIESTTLAIQTAFDKLTKPSARQKMLSELQCM